MTRTRAYMNKAANLAAVCAALALAACATSRTAGETIDDTTIASSVKMGLISDDVAPGGEINVETYKGRVQLIGFIRTEDERKAAIARAKETDGVVKVEDAMVIASEGRTFGTAVDDQTIQTKVKYGISRMRASDGLAVVTDVRNGEVLLGGFVTTEAEKAEIGRITSDVEGVTKVHNLVTLK